MAPKRTTQTIYRVTWKRTGRHGQQTRRYVRRVDVENAIEKLHNPEPTARQAAAGKGNTAFPLEYLEVDEAKVTWFTSPEFERQLPREQKAPGEASLAYYQELAEFRAARAAQE